MKHVVVWDPKNEYWEGAIVDDKLVGDLEARGVALLPCVPELFSHAGFSAYAKRAWGAGWPMEGAMPQFMCPLSIYYPGEPYRTLHWKARLVGQKGQGIPLRMAAGEGRGNVIRPVLQEPGGAGNAVDVAKLEDADEEGGWTVGGRAILCGHGPAMYALGLFGLAPGMRIAWVAATLTP